MTEQNDSDREARIRLLMAAIEEYHKNGTAGSVICDRCAQPIVITMSGEMGTSYESNCGCGRYRDTLRGL
jgi:hypothetical protein